MNDQQLKMLDILAKQAIHLLEFDTSLKILKDMYLQAKDSANKLRSFFNASSSLHLLIGKEMQVLAYNTVAKEIAPQLFGKEMQKNVNMLEYLEERYQKRFVTNFNKCLEGTSTDYERMVDGPDGEAWWHVTYNPAKDEEGNIIGVSFNATDISKRVYDEKRLDEQQLALKQIAWMQSHELRKPVSSILGLMEIIRDSGFKANKDVLLMLEKATQELDDKIRLIVDRT